MKALKAHRLTPSHVRMLQAIRMSDFKGDEAGLESLIGTADWLDHSIPEFAEFNDAVYYLKQAGLLRQRGRVLGLTPAANALFKEFEAFAPLKQHTALCKRLEVAAPTGPSDPATVTAPEIFLPEERYRHAVGLYTREFTERYGL
jgi:hypothetical protein